MTSEIIPLVITGLFALAGSVLLFIGTRGKTKSDESITRDKWLDERTEKEIARLDTRIDDQNAEIGALRALLKKEKDARRAALRVIRQFVAAWPGPPYPQFDPSDLAELDEDTIPSRMRDHKE